MQLPEPLFSIGLWFAFAVVAADAVYLLATLIREWRKGELW